MDIGREVAISYTISRDVASNSSSDSKVSEASSSRERIGRVPFAASNCVTDRPGWAAALPASLSALDVLTRITLLSAAYLSGKAH